MQHTNPPPAKGDKEGPGADMFLPPLNPPLQRGRSVESAKVLTASTQSTTKLSANGGNTHATAYPTLSSTPPAAPPQPPPRQLGIAQAEVIVKVPTMDSVSNYATQAVAVAAPCANASLQVPPSPPTLLTPAYIIIQTHYAGLVWG